MGHLIFFSLTLHGFFLLAILLLPTTNQVHEDRFISELMVCFSEFSGPNKTDLLITSKESAFDRAEKKQSPHAVSLVSPKKISKMVDNAYESKINDANKTTVKKKKQSPRFCEKNAQHSDTKIVPKPIISDKNNRIANNTKAITKDGQKISAMNYAVTDNQEIFTRLMALIEKQWIPPVGLGKDLSCTIKVIITPQGMVKDLLIEKSSKVIAYDMAAKHALAFLSFPALYHGKEMSITFKQ